MKNKIAIAIGALFCMSGVYGIFEKLIGENKESVAGTIIAGLICIAIGAAVIYLGIKKPEFFDKFKKKNTASMNIDSDTVYVVPGKKIYHTYDGCQSLTYADFDEMSEQKAIKKGFRKCKNCERYYM